jgi:hypothetical protein
MYDEDSELESGFKMDADIDEDAIPDLPGENDFGLDEEDPDKDS